METCWIQLDPGWIWVYFIGLIGSILMSWHWHHRSQRWLLRSPRWSSRTSEMAGPIISRYSSWQLNTETTQAQIVWGGLLYMMDNRLQGVCPREHPKQYLYNYCIRTSCPIVNVLFLDMMCHPTNTVWHQ